MENLVMEQALAVFGPPGIFAGLLAFQWIQIVRNGRAPRDPLAEKIDGMEKSLTDLRERLARIEGALGVGK